MPVTPKRKLHLVLTRLPYPPVGGDKLKSFNLVKILSKHFNLHIVVVTDEKQTQESREFLEEYAAHFRVFSFPKWRFWFNTSRALFNSQPIQANYYYYRAVQKYINSQVEKDDIIICNLIRSTAYCLHFPNTKLLDIVDSISINYRRSINKVESVFWKLIYRIEMHRVERFEKKCLANFDATFYVNMFEAEHWASYGKTVWIPNGVNSDLLHYHYFADPKYKKVITFFGKMDYQPNVDAVKWFVEKCLPYVDKKYTFLIVGANPSKVVMNLAAQNPRVSYTGFVPDPYFILASSGLVVAPMQTGGGIQNKILESMALGCIVVTTDLGGKPIKDAIDEQHILVQDDAYKMALLINEVLDDPSAFSHIAANAKALIQEKYTWAIYEDRLMRLLSDLGVEATNENAGSSVQSVNI